MAGTLKELLTILAGILLNGGKSSLYFSSISMGLPHLKDPAEDFETSLLSRSLSRTIAGSDHLSAWNWSGIAVSLVGNQHLQVHSNHRYARTITIYSSRRPPGLGVYRTRGGVSALPFRPLPLPDKFLSIIRRGSFPGRNQEGTGIRPVLERFRASPCTGEASLRSIHRTW